MEGLLSLFQNFMVNHFRPLTTCLSQWVLSSWFFLRLSAQLCVICVPNHLWTRPGSKFKVELGISLQRNINVINYVLYADLEVSKIIGLRFTPLWKA